MIAASSELSKQPTFNWWQKWWQNQKIKRIILCY